MRSLMTFAVLVPVLVVAGCAAPIQNLTKTQYLNPVFTADTLGSGGLALLPITAGQGQEGYRRPLGDFLNAALKDIIPGGKVLTWQSAMDSLNHHGLVTLYQGVIEAYQRTSILDRDQVKQLRAALGVRYALYCSLQDFSQTSHTSFSILSGPSTTRTANVEAHCLVLDLNTGDIMQEIIGQATSEAQGDFMHNSPYDAYAAAIANAVVAQLPGAKAQPTDTPKKRNWDQGRNRNK